MKKKLIIASVILSALILSFSYVFAANENNGGGVVDGIRNVVGGAENAVEGVATGVGNGIKDMTGATTTNGGNSSNNGTTGTTGDNGGYTATRTATTRAAATGTDTFLGLSATAWTWLIMAIVGIVTIGLIWAYSKQYDNNDNIISDNNDKY